MLTERIFHHLENLTIMNLIMSEIRSSYATNQSQANQLSDLADVLLHFDDWTIIVQQRIVEFR